MNWTEEISESSLENEIGCWLLLCLGIGQSSSLYVARLVILKIEYYYRFRIGLGIFSVGIFWALRVLVGILVDRVGGLEEGFARTAICVGICEWTLM